MSRWANFDLRIEETPQPRTRKPKSKPPSIGGDSKVSNSSSSSAGGERPQTADRSKTATHRQNQSRPNTGRPSTLASAAPIVEQDPRASIRDDPFFRPYQSVQSARMAEKISRDEPPKSPEEAPKSGSVPQINLVVLGGQGVGKSTFIQRALDLRQMPTTQASAKKMSLDSVIYLVKLMEIPLDDIVLAGKSRITWPSTIDGQPMPTIDGVLVLYDVTNQYSISNFRNILNSLSLNGIPCVIVSCKCDNPPKVRQIEAGTVEELGQDCGGIDAYQTSANVPESQKRCISILLRTILAKKADSKQTSGSRSRASTINQLSPSGSSPSKLRQGGRLESPKFGQNKGKGISNSALDSEFEPRQPKAHARQVSESFIFDGPSSSRNQRGDITPPFPDWESQKPPGSPTSYLLDSALRPSTADSQAHNTFLNMDDDDHSEILPDNMSISVQSTADMASLKITDKEQSENGSTFDELVDRLLSLPMSKAEGKFVPIFLCLYRKFAAPNQLLSAILGRFDSVEKSGEAQLTRVGEQLRYLQVLAQWTSDYPGDFAHPTTKNELTAFVERLEKSRIFTYNAKEINNHLENVMEDDDTGWAFHDSDPSDKTNESQSLLSQSTTLASRKSKASLDDSIKDSLTASREDLGDTSSRNSAVPSIHSSIGRSYSGSAQSLATLMTYEEASKEAQTLNPVPRRRLDKNIWRQFMALPGEDIARELTRIDWIMYSSIRPRDLVRHVSLSGDKKDKSKSLENVNRMINHFNHVALFVSSMILYRDKPKHRALALEKFMHIAWKLRQQNNYNSLGSVIAGINGTAIHRLAMTRELVPPQVQKEFMRLVILMGTGKSHFAYRLAWENSFSEKIPFLPLHRRDLVAAEDGNRTLVGPNNDRINWKKFEVMGDVIIEIQRSQERPYPYIQRSDDILRFLLETKFLEGDEDTIDPYQELYERSVQLEPNGAADAKKSFWGLRGR